jgi:prepilin-type N-terminal cleavage/methylation domain-containing protein
MFLGGNAMNKLRINHNEKGFTLIELMIVIAIIGILAAIAIPNFIAYRNKSFCSAAESDANSVAAAIADYFAIPTNVSLTNTANLGIAATLSNDNTWVVNAADPNALIEISVTDASGRCPNDYQTAMTVATSPRGYWDGANVYVKNMTL